MKKKWQHERHCIGSYVQRWQSSLRSYLAGEGILQLLWNQKIHDHVQNTPLITIPITGMNAVQVPMSYSFGSILISTSNPCLRLTIEVLFFSLWLIFFAFILFKSSLIRSILPSRKLSHAEDSRVLRCDAVFTFLGILKECQATLTQKHGVTSQKTWILNAAVETLYLTWSNIV